MSDFIIAAAQLSSVKGDIEANIRNHTRFLSIAVKNHVDVVIFPELSLTGYEPEIASVSTINIDDQRLSPLRKFAEHYNLTAIVGAPVSCRSGKPYIGSLILDSLHPAIYLKRHLHPGEEAYFTAGDQESCIIHKNGENVGVAICADIDHPCHPKEAAKNGASIYAAGVVMMNGYSESKKQLQQYAREYSMAVVMANYNAPTGKYHPVGKSAVWDNSGNSLASAAKKEDALVLLIRQRNGWTGKVMRL